MCMLGWSSLLPEWSFRDLRLRRRALLLLDGLLRAPGESFASVFGKHSAAARQAYDFCENDAMEFQSLLAPAFLTTGKLIREDFASVLVIQDTTELDLTTHKAMKGLGESGNPKGRGIFLHAGLAVTPDGLPLGPLSALTWVRPPEDHGKATERRARPFDDKESSKWWKTIENAEHAVNCPGKLVHIGDREIDVFEVFARCLASGYRGLFRAAQDRALLDAPHKLLWAQAESWKVVGSRTVELPERRPRKDSPAREARTAVLELRFGPVTLAQPETTGKGHVTLCAVFVREVDPPSAADCIEWLLLSTDILATVEDAWTRVDWYRRRWLIEEFHKCLKTTCQVELRQFDDRPHFETYLALVLLVSLRILFLRNIARAEPDTPAREFLSQDEEQVVRAAHDEGARIRFPAVLTASLAVRFIARLGGFMARKGDGEPGFQTLAKGYAKLAAMVAGYRLARGLPTQSEPALSDLTCAPAQYFHKRTALPSPH